MIKAQQVINTSISYTQTILGDGSGMELVVGLNVVFVIVYLQLHEQDNVHARGYFTPIKLAHM